MEIRTIRDDEIAAYREAMTTVFGGDVDDDTGGPERFRATVDLSRAWAAYDRGVIVATAATFTLDIGIPGGETRMGGLTMVAVRPTHRRRGLLRRLMQHHIDDSRARREAIQGLWASEATIYGRFGFGVASEHDDLEIAGGPDITVTVPGEPDTTDWIDEATARSMLPPVYARATAARPGVLRRTEPWWRERRFLEAPFARRGASKLRHVVARRGDEVTGYVAYRQRDAQGETPGGRAQIHELIAVDPRAEASLWRFALAIDLFPAVTWWNAPVDCMLPWIVSDPRKIKRHRADSLWLRIDDVPAALAARRYAAEDVLRFRIDDKTWELVVEDGTGRCAATDRQADLRLDRPALGSLYLGGVSATLLARAGRIDGAPAAVARAERLFAWPVAPWCSEVF